MRIVLSRKGFDTGSGGTASPIIGGRPISLPIPTSRRSITSYDHLGLGDIVEKVTRGKVGRDHLCHEDPMFVGDQCIFGQCGMAQSHLKNQCVDVGDVFLFFGLFSDDLGKKRHHRIFGFLRIDDVAICLPESSLPSYLNCLPRRHPHTIGDWNANNTIYRGAGRAASRAHAGLRLTQPGGPLRQWVVPTWLRDAGLSFHGKAERWLGIDRLEVVARGQEFVVDIGSQPGPRSWLDHIIGMVEA